MATTKKPQSNKPTAGSKPSPTNQGKKGGAKKA